MPRTPAEPAPTTSPRAGICTMIIDMACCGGGRRPADALGQPLTADGEALSVGDAEASSETASAGVSFRVNDVEQPAELRPATSAEERIRQLAKPAAAWRHRPGGAAQRAADSPEGLVAPDSMSSHKHRLLRSAENGFIAAVTIAFAEHYPLALRPEHIWTLVLQGVAAHVNQHAEALRPKFVAHDGKKQLLIRRDEFRLGASGDDWRGVVAEFSEQIAQNTVAGTAELMATDFSSTTADERVAGQMTVMHVLEQYFDFGMMSMCGFPSITLEGTLEDWRGLRRKAEAMVRGTCTEEFGAWWLAALLPVLERFVAQYEDPARTDVPFWQSMAKQGGVGGSGGCTWLNGWYNVLFPQLKSGGRNPFCVAYSPDSGYAQEDPSKPVYYAGHFGGLEQPPGVRGPELDSIPTGILSAPVTWAHLGSEIPLQFRSGFVGAEQREDGTIAPAIGWFIRHTPQDAPEAA